MTARRVEDSALAIHPAASVWPMLSEDELADLAADIKANGLIHPVVLTPAGEVLDGRNRLEACKIADVEPTYVTHDGDPIAYVLAANSQRRHMTIGARAMAGWMALFQNKTLPYRAAAKQIGVHVGHVGWAAVVSKWTPELVDRIIAGKLSLSDAYTAAKDRKDAADQGAEQRKAIAEQYPDLGPAVDRGEITSAEALRVGRKRDADAAKVARDNAERLARAVVLLVGSLNGDEMRADLARSCLEYADTIRGVEADYFNPDGIRLAADNLGRFADAMQQAER